MMLRAAIRKTHQFVDIKLVAGIDRLVDTGAVEDRLKFHFITSEKSIGIVINLMIALTDFVSNVIIAKAGGISEPLAGSTAKQNEQ